MAQQEEHKKLKTNSERNPTRSSVMDAMERKPQKTKQNKTKPNQTKPNQNELSLMMIMPFLGHLAKIKC
jgi:hypothetical protein